MSIGRQIAALRARAGITQAELARLAGCAQSLICKVESGGNTSLERFQSIATALGEYLVIHPVFVAEE